MRKKKVLGLMLSFTLAFGIALPATMAMPLESAIIASDSDATETDSNAIETDSNAAKNIFIHKEGCFDGCIIEECECLCHVPTLFERIMACKSLSELDNLLVEVSENELLLLTEEENEIIRNHIKTIEPAPYPAIELKDTSDAIVLSENVYLGVSYTNVAPIGDPVIGSAE